MMPIITLLAIGPARADLRVDKWHYQSPNRSCSEILREANGELISENWTAFIDETTTRLQGASSAAELFEVMEWVRRHPAEIYRNVTTDNYNRLIDYYKQMEFIDWVRPFRRFTAGMSEGERAEAIRRLADLWQIEPEYRNVTELSEQVQIQLAGGHLRDRLFDFYAVAHFFKGHSALDFWTWRSADRNFRPFSNALWSALKGQWTPLYNPSTLSALESLGTKDKGLLLRDLRRRWTPLAASCRHFTPGPGRNDKICPDLLPRRNTEILIQALDRPRLMGLVATLRNLRSAAEVFPVLDHFLIGRNGFVPSLDSRAVFAIAKKAQKFLSHIRTNDAVYFVGSLPNGRSAPESDFDLLLGERLSYESAREMNRNLWTAQIKEAFSDETERVSLIATEGPFVQGAHSEHWEPSRLFRFFINGAIGYRIQASQIDLIVYDVFERRSFQFRLE